MSAACITVAQGGTVNDDLDNAGTVSNSGAMNAKVNTNTGTITNASTGVWTGDVTSNASNSAGITNNGTWVGNVVANTGTIDNNSTWTGTISNAGTFNNNAGGTVSGSADQHRGPTINDGQLNGGATVTGGIVTNNNLISGR